MDKANGNEKQASPIISIIVPVYNVEKYLKRCIDSILAQTFSDFELILVDDGSPDNCGAICDEYEKKDARIRVIHKENGGLSDARNAGLDLVYNEDNSEWISFIDSDDYIHPRFLEYMLKATKGQNVPMSMCFFKIVSDLEPDFEEILYTAKTMDAMELYTDDKIGHLGITAWNKIYSKEIFSGYRYPKGKVYEDAFLTHELLYKAKQVAVIEKPLYNYFTRPGSITNSNYTKTNLQEIEAFRCQREFFKGKHKGAYIKATKYLIIKLHKYICISNSEKNMRIFRKELKSEIKKVIAENKKQCDLSVYHWYSVYKSAYPIFSVLCYPYVLLRRIVGSILKKLKIR